MRINEIGSSREECVELMSMLPNYGDLHCFSWLLFSKDQKVVELAVELFTRLEREKVRVIQEGKVLIDKMTYKELMRYKALK